MIVSREFRSMALENAAGRKGMDLRASDASAKILADGPDAFSTTAVSAFASDIIYNADRTRAYVARDDGNITVYNTFTGAVIATWDVGNQLAGMDISADGSFLLVVEKVKVSGTGADDTFAIRKIDTATGTEVAQFTKQFGTVFGPFQDVALFANGTAMVTTTVRGSGQTETYLLDSATGVFTLLTSNSAQGGIVTASADRLSVLLTNGWNVSGPNQLWTMDAAGAVTLAAQRGPESSGNSLHAFSADGTLIAYVERQAGAVLVFDAQFNLLATIPGTAGPGGVWIAGVAFDDHGDFLYFNDGAARAIVKVSTATWTVVGTVPYTESAFSHDSMNYGSNLVVGPDAQYFLFRGSDEVYRLENPLAIVPVQGNDGGADTLTGTANADILYGLGGNDALIGLGGDDVLRGGAGHDVLDGGTGHDAMYGGDGDDTYIVDDVRDLAGEASASGGNDQVLASVSYELAGNIEQLLLLGASAINGTGNATANTIYGNGAANVLAGMGGDDVMIGGGGGDTLKGGSGADRMYGGTGDDTYEADRADDLVFENANEGTDTVLASANYYLYANVENLTLTGTAGNFGVGNGLDNVISGNSGANLLIGGGGNDTLNGAGGIDSLYGEDGVDTLNGGSSGDLLVGGADDDFLDGGTGNDRLYGGTGDDSYFVDSSADLVFEDAGGGTDSVFASANAYLYANVENLYFTGTGDFMGAGNELDNVIRGNSGNNLLTGGAGADMIVGDQGNDSLYGESGHDTLLGGIGNDLLVGGDGNDSISGGEGADRIFGEDGDDELNGGTNSGSDLIVGGAGNDIIRANMNAGNDDLYGGSGDDTYYIETYTYFSGPGFNTRNDLIDLVFEDADGGTDTVYYSTNFGSVYYMTANVENLFLVGSAQDAVGNATANRMTGNTGTNLLLGGGGNDVLNGKGSNDVLFGQAGADTFVFERGTGGDVIGDFVTGTDKIDLSVWGFDYQDVVNSMHQNGADTAIDLGNGDFIVVKGVAASSFSVGDFILSGGSSAEMPFDDLGDVEAPVAMLQSVHAADPIDRPDAAHAQIWHGGAMDMILL